MNIEQRTFNKVMKQRARRRAYLARKRQMKGKSHVMSVKKIVDRAMKNPQVGKVGIFRRFVNWFKNLWQKTK